MDAAKGVMPSAQAFEAWSQDANLSENTISLLKREELDDLGILKLLPDSEIKDLGIPRGQALLLRAALKRLTSETGQETQDSGKELTEVDSFSTDDEDDRRTGTDVDADGSEIRRRNIQVFPSTPATVVTAAKRKQLRNLNAFTQRKTVTQGLMDMAMMSANSSQVAVVLKDAMGDVGFGGYQIFLLALLSLSLVLQLAVAILLFLKSQVNVEEADDDDDDDEPNSHLAHKYNNWAMSLTMVIMADNVLISSLGIK